MASKRRILRIALTVLVVLAIFGWGAFTTQLFNPFEGSYRFALPSLIPREVDFFLAKADLRDDFDPFPQPAFYEALAEDEKGQALLGLLGVEDRLEALGVREALDGLDRAMEGVPLNIELLSVFGGENIAVGGFFRGTRLDESDWAVYGRVNWIGKLGIELLGFPDLIGIEDQGMTVEELEDGFALSGGPLARTLYLRRIQDVVIVATSESFLERAGELDRARGENSLGLSAKYGDNIGLLERKGSELELYVDYDKLSETLSLPQVWPDPYSDRVGPSILGKLFQLGHVRDVAGIVGFGQGLSLRLHGDLSSEAMSPVQKRLYRMRGFDKARAKEVAKLVPEDAGLFAFVTLDVGDFLRQALGSVEDSAVENFEDLVRQVWGYSDYTLLIDDFEAAFKDRCAFVLRNHDYPDEGESGPPHNDDVVPAWALILWPDNESKVEQLATRIRSRQDAFGIHGRVPGSPGVFSNEVLGGYKVYEYWSELIPGTGHVATVDLADYFIISNQHQMLGAMVKTYFDGAPSWPRLSEKPYFQTLVNTGLSSTNVLLWGDPRAIADTTHELARQAAALNVFIDWDVERPRLEKQILAREFPGAVWGALSPDVEQQLSVLYDVEAEEFRRDFVAQKAPALRAEYERQLSALEVTSGTMVQLALDDKSMDLFMRVVVPLE